MMSNFDLENVQGWCKDVSEKAEQIATHALDVENKQYWLGQRDALRDLGWFIKWKLDGEPDFEALMGDLDINGSQD